MADVLNPENISEFVIRELLAVAEADRTGLFADFAEPWVQKLSEGQNDAEELEEIEQFSLLEQLWWQLSEELYDDWPQHAERHSFQVLRAFFDDFELGGSRLRRCLRRSENRAGNYRHSGFGVVVMVLLVLAAAVAGWIGYTRGYLPRQDCFYDRVDQVGNLYYRVHTEGDHCDFALSEGPWQKAVAETEIMASVKGPAVCEAVCIQASKGDTWASYVVVGTDLVAVRLNECEERGSLADCWVEGEKAVREARAEIEKKSEKTEKKAEKKQEKTTEKTENKPEKKVGKQESQESQEPQLDENVEAVVEIPELVDEPQTVAEPAQDQVVEEIEPVEVPVLANPDEDDEDDYTE